VSNTIRESLKVDRIEGTAKKEPKESLSENQGAKIETRGSRRKDREAKIETRGSRRGGESKRISLGNSAEKEGLRPRPEGLRKALGQALGKAQATSLGPGRGSKIPAKRASMWKNRGKIRKTGFLYG
jgi:hypothetical protein